MEDSKVTDIPRCLNKVEIRGKMHTVERVFEACKQRKLLNYLNPLDKASNASPADIAKQWGVVWEPLTMDASLDMRSGLLKVIFETPVYPPVLAFYKGELNHSLDITAFYIQPDLNYAGYYESGRENTYKLDYSEKGMNPDLPRKLIEGLDLHNHYQTWKEEKSHD